MAKMGINELGYLGLTLAVAAIMVSIGADVVNDVQTGQSNDGYAYNASEEGLQGLEEFSSWFDTIAIVLAASIVIGYLGFLR